MALPVSKIRRQFPSLALAKGLQPAYLDHAATAQKPESVLQAVRDFYAHGAANAHRGVHALAEQTTAHYEAARSEVRTLLHARSADEIVFTRNATEGINLVAKTFGKTFLQKGDTVLLSILEHHSNIVPWMQLRDEHGTLLKWIDCDDTGQVRLDDFSRALAEKNVKLVAITGQSNVLGIRPPLEKMIPLAHEAGAKVLVDAAQLVAHSPVDVQALDCDFLVFSGHKIFGPTGIGVLYGKRELLQEMPPFLGGGKMILEVTKDHFTPADPPARFEAGTMPAAEAVGLMEAIRWAKQYSWEDRDEHEHTLLALALEGLHSIAGTHILGPEKIEERSGVIAFTIDGVHPHDLSDLLGEQGIFLRAGHHCAEPLHRRLGVNASLRLSVSLYNTEEEINRFITALKEIQKRFSSI